jgi:DNA polymerase-1
MSRWKKKADDKNISKWRISDHSTEHLIQAKDFVGGLLNLRKSEKLYRTYVKGVRNAALYNEEDKVYVDYKLDGTTTGRLSCTAYNAAKSMGVSFHTLPRETKNNIRSIFVAPPGFRFMTVDYASMELRVLAHIAKEYKMQKAFKEGIDLHRYTGSLLFNKSQDKVTKQERQVAKTTSFLIVYGGSKFQLSDIMRIPIRKADKVIEAYKEVYPGIFRYMEFIEKFIRKNKYAYSIFGRRRNLPDIDSNNFSVASKAVRQGINFTIQSTASDILVCSLIGISDKLEKKGMKTKIVSTVHDSLELISPSEEVDEACSIIHNEMVNYPYIKKHFGLSFDVPLVIEILVGDSFGDGEEYFVESADDN